MSEASIQQREPIEVYVLDDEAADPTWVPAFCAKLAQLLSGAKVQARRRVSDLLDARPHEVSPDVILLDVLDMDMRPSQAIPALHLRWPRLPVIILSKNNALEPAITYFRAGARAYLLKSNLRTDLVPSLFGNAVGEAEQAWQDAAALVASYADEYRPIKRILSANRIIGQVRKRAGGPNSPLRDQIEFMQRVLTIRDVKWLFPDYVERIDVEGGALAYDIPFYRARSLRRLLLDCRTTHEIYDTATAVLKPVLTTLYEKLFCGASDAQPVGASGFVRRSYSERLRDRMEQSRVMAAATDASLSDTALTRLLNASTIYIDDVAYDPPEVVLGRILQRPDIVATLIPPRLGWIHGDLHFDNILADAAIPESPFLKLIDPRGLYEGDFAYDVGKLLHSCHGFYDMIDEGYLSYDAAIGDITLGNGTIHLPAAIRKEWVTSKAPGGSQDEVVSHLRELTESHYAGYTAIATWLTDEFLPDLLSAHDPLWLRRARLHEALHFCTMAPFHIRRGAAKVITIFAQGVRLLNDFEKTL